MSQRSNGLKTLLFLALVAVFILATVCFFVPRHSQVRPFVHASDNEVFLNLQQRYEHHIEHTILKLLEPLVGRGKVQASVQVELNLKNARHNIRTYSPKADENITTQQTFEKQIQNLIQKQNISVIIDGNTRKGDRGIYQPRSAQEMAAYKRLIQSATGYDITRGDTLEIQNMPFVKPLHKHHKHPFFCLGGILVILALILIFGALTCILGKSTQKHPHADFSPDILDKIAENPTRAITVIKNWIYMPVNAKSTDWTPIQKVGIVLLALDENIVRQILIALDDNEVRKVAKTMTSLGVIPPQESARILTELHQGMTNGSAVVGNAARVQQILSESPNEETLKFKETLQTPHSSLWQELAEISTDILVPRLSTLRPEITAYILYHLPTEKASDLLQNFPENKTTQILIHLSHIGHISPTTTAKMQQEALAVTRDILNTIHTPTGTQKTSEILSQLSNTETGQAVLKDLNQKEPFLARKLASTLIRFTDLAHWTDQNVQILLRHIPRATAILALANAPADVKKTIQHNIPQSLWPQIQLDIENKEKQAESDQINRARQEIVDTIKTLLNQGKIQL